MQAEKSEKYFCVRLPNPGRNWFGGPMSAVIYATPDADINGTLYTAEIRNDKAMPLEGKRVVEVLHSKSGDDDFDFIDRVVQFIRSDNCR